MFIDGTLPIKQYAKNFMRFAYLLQNLFESLNQRCFVLSAKTYNESSIFGDCTISFVF